jgi:hypothetical protein
MLPELHQVGKLYLSQALSKNKDGLVKTTTAYTELQHCIIYNFC